MQITDTKIHNFYAKQSFVNNICQKICQNIDNIPNYKDFKRIIAKCSQILTNFLYSGEVTPEDDAFFDKNKQIFKYRELITSYYRMKLSSKAIIQGDKIHIQRSKSKLDGYCQSIKSNTLRHLYSLYFQDNTDILKNYYPATMVITVQHDKDGFAGERFYHSKLLSMFKEFRREHKAILQGGTYNVETTHNDNGFHIHLHCFVLLPYDVNLNEIRPQLNNSWKIKTGNKEAYNPIQLSSIYYIKNGKKQYYKKNWSPKLFFKAFQEVCKYNMKLDNVQKLDIDTINDYLISSKHKRLFSRFGNMYDMSYLSPTNKNNLIKQHYERLRVQKLAEVKRKLSGKVYNRCNQDIVFDKVKLPLKAKLYNMDWLYNLKTTTDYDTWIGSKNVGSTDMKLNITDIYKGRELTLLRGDEILHPSKRKSINLLSENEAETIKIIDDERKELKKALKAQMMEVKQLIQDFETRQWRATRPPPS